MILAVDIGNSSISCGVYTLTDSVDNPAQCKCRFSITSIHLSVDEYLLQFTQFLRFYGFDVQLPVMHSVFEKHVQKTPLCTFLHASVLASVVPGLTDNIAAVMEILTGIQPFRIGPGIRTGFGIHLKNPEQLGADIVANIAGALSVAEAPMVVLDVGTASTITYVNCRKELLGTIIMPGLAVSMEALSHSAALLYDAPLEKSPELLGKNTSEALRSGVIGGHVLMVDGFIRNIREQMEDKGKPLSLLATGGLSKYILPCCRNKFRYIEDLTLRGAVCLYQTQSAKK